VIFLGGNACMSGGAGQSLMLFMKGADGNYQTRLGFPAAAYTLKPRAGLPDIRVFGLRPCAGVWRWDGEAYTHVLPTVGRQRWPQAQEYQRGIRDNRDVSGEQHFRFTPDSTKLVYLAGSGNSWFAVVNGQEIEPAFSTHPRVTFSERGNAVASSISPTRARCSAARTSKASSPSAVSIFGRAALAASSTVTSARPPGARTIHGLLQAPRPIRFPFGPTRGLAARCQGPQPRCQLRDAGEPPARIAVRRTGDVLAQQRVGHLTFPSGRHGPPQVTHQQLIEHHAQAVEIALHRRRAASDQLRREVQRGTAAAVGRQTLGQHHAQRGHAQHFETIRFQEPAIAEVCQARPHVVALLADQQVGRLQILVQHPHAVRRGDGVTDLQEQADPPLRGDARKVPGLGPFRQARAAVFAFEKVRGQLEVPVDDAGEVVAPAQALLQQP
jgi:hypothetical protein